MRNPSSFKLDSLSIAFTSSAGMNVVAICSGTNPPSRGDTCTAIATNTTKHAANNTV